MRTARPPKELFGFFWDLEPLALFAQGTDQLSLQSGGVARMAYCTLAVQLATETIMLKAIHASARSYLLIALPRAVLGDTPYGSQRANV